MAADEPKQIYTRADLVTYVEEPDGFVVATCDLCGGTSLLDTEAIEHASDCPLADPEVVGVDVLIRTMPRGGICDECPASNADQPNCVVLDWTLESHERLRKLCGRYAVEDI